jgi:histidine triad (HIT) family protein
MMANPPADNLFVMLLNGEIPSTEVWSNELVYCFLDLYPQNPGHTLVIPREYSPNYLEASPAALAACWDAIRYLAPALKAATSARGVTVVSNMGREAGQMIEYLHFHVIPRHPQDKLSYYETGKQQTPEQLSEMATAIQKHLA